MANKIPVLFCFDERILLGAGVSILSLIETASPDTVYDIRVLHPGLPKDAVDALNLLTKDTRHDISYKEIPSTRFKDVPKNKGSWTEIVYYRLLASEFLTDCDQVIYSDVDVLFKKDMTAVFNTQIDEFEWAGTAAEANTDSTIMHRHFPENTNDVIFFSGFMLMNLKLIRQNDAIGRYFDTIKTVGPRLKFFDLDVLNIATPKIFPLPFDYVVLEDVYESAQVSDSADYPYLATVYSDQELEKACADPAIIHYAGKRGKPWQRRRVPPYYADVAGRLPRRLQKLTFRDWRRKWLSSKGRRKHFMRSDAV